MKENEEIQKILSSPAKMIYTGHDESDFLSATHCNLCEKPLGTDRVRDHCHISGKYRSALHSSCNLRYKLSKNVPVIFHNGKNYDSHFILQELGQFGEKKVSCIPNNTEKYISFSVDNLVFMDSIQFMNASLDTLVTNLSKSGGLSRFQHLIKHTENNKASLLLRKGVYCYEYMDGPDKFNCDCLPPIDAFYSYLSDETISKEDYNYAIEIWQAFNIPNLGVYHDLYLLSDTLLLADVFENFREFCFDHYGLDCLHFQTLPPLSWQACLKMTKVKLKLLTDPTMFIFCEEMLRGGISTINRKYAKANNPHMDDYNPNEENSYIVYLDANNLYGYAMSDPLPVSHFEWLSDADIENFDFERLDYNQQLGYIFDVDLSYPEHLHDLHNSYPLAPQKLEFDETMLSDYSKHLYEHLSSDTSKQSAEPFHYKSVPKLIPNLNDKANYILHGKSLALYLRLGMEVKRINRVLRFVQ